MEPTTVVILISSLSLLIGTAGVALAIAAHRRNLRKDRMDRWEDGLPVRGADAAPLVRHAYVHRPRLRWFIHKYLRRWSARGATRALSIIDRGGQADRIVDEVYAMLMVAAVEPDGPTTDTVEAWLKRNALPLATELLELETSRTPNDAWLEWLRRRVDRVKRFISRR